MTQENTTEILKNTVTEKLCNIIAEAKLTSIQTAEVLTLFLFSIGASLEKCNISDSQQLLLRYSQNPTFGNAMMIQALWIRDTWFPCIKDRKDKDNE